ncbi:terpene synthase family protein [Actinocrispum sp. NPDC049592]|uniref:terpene synthase family protein n=1 Tax=Actinocrispum sp. NPDC049592 TaxID=3154835 RepID=UPI00342F652B
MSVAPLLALTSADPWLAAPSRSHRDVPAVAGAALRWAQRNGLRDSQRFIEFASRAFPETRPDRVALFAEWLIWVFHFDDELDEGALGRNPAEVARFCANLAESVRSPSENPLQRAFAQLWNRTVPGMSEVWRQRFVDDFLRYVQAIEKEAENRELKRVPDLAGYPDLRRCIAGPFMYDLMEPVIGVEVPPEIAETDVWWTLVNGAIDVIAWSNDIASREKETAHGDVHNYVLVAAHHLGLDDAASCAWVVDRIQERLRDMHTAARQLPALLRPLPHKQARDTSKVACTLLGAPRGHLDWLCESPRYAADSPGFHQIGAMLGGDEPAA